MIDYICKIATVDEMERKWNYEIQKNKSLNWKIWKAEAIERVGNGQSIAYYGILNGEIICETTAMLDKRIVQNSDKLVDDKTAYLCAFRTIEKYQGKGCFSKLFRFMIDDLKSKGYEKVTLGVEPTETENLKIYQHLGFNEFIKSAREAYPDGTVIDVDYYGMYLCQNDSEYEKIIKIVCETFPHDLKEKALYFVSYLNSNSLTFERLLGYWKSQCYYSVKYENESVCYILLNGTGDEQQFAPLTIWSDDSGSNWYEHYPLSDDLKKTAWDNVDYCV